MSEFDREVRRFIADNFYVPAGVAELAGDESLTRTGIIDSVGIVELIHFLETRFGVDVLDEETTPENIDTVDNITRYVAAKLGATAGRSEAHP